MHFHASNGIINNRTIRAHSARKWGSDRKADSFMYPTELNFQKDTFKLIQLTDIHLVHMDGAGPEQQTLDMIARMQAAEQPDLFVMTGDLLFSEENEKNLSLFCDFMDELGTPWAFVFGNHDREERFHFPTEKIEARLWQSKTCIYRHGERDVEGDGNYTVRLFDGEKLPWVLYMIDSHDYISIAGHHPYAHIRHSQIEWYRRTRDALRGEFGKSSSLFFFHIPLPEYRNVWDEMECYGEKNEGVCSSYLNSGFFAALKEDDSAKGTFVGHDHVNDYIGDYHGIRLAYGRGTGFSGDHRGAYSREGFRQGGRVILLNRDPSVPFQTYLWLADGTVLEQPVHMPGSQQ